MNNYMTICPSCNIEVYTVDIEHGECLCCGLITKASFYAPDEYIPSNEELEEFAKKHPITQEEGQ